MTEEKQLTIKQLILFKIDRNVAIIGLIAIGLVALSIDSMSDAAVKIVSNVVTGLSMYLGIRLGNK